MEEWSQHGGTEDAYGTKGSVLQEWTKRTKSYHGRIPYINKLPFPAIAVIIAVGCVNALVWVAAGIVLVRE